jgi:hypothetical protein
MSERVDITMDEVKNAERDTLDHVMGVLQKKGMGSFSSTHELWGVIRDEYREFEDAVHGGKGRPPAFCGKEYVIHELADLAAACIFGIACIRSGKMDW